jgi:hypothetical protein
MATRITTQLAPTDIWSYTSDKRFDLGGKGETPDGRTFRYVRAGGTAIVPGKLYQSAAEDATNWENIAVGINAIGATSITTTGTITAAKDLFAGGWLVIADDAGEGYMYKIAGNTAATAAVCTITLEEPLVVATTAATTIDIIPNLCQKVEIWDSSNHDGAIIGVGVAPVTALYYGWVQCGGPATVLDNGGLTVGYLAVASNAIDGAVEVATGGSTEAQYPIGQIILGSTDTEYGSVYLNLP